METTYIFILGCTIGNAVITEIPTWNYFDHAIPRKILYQKINSKAQTRYSRHILIANFFRRKFYCVFQSEKKSYINLILIYVIRAIIFDLLSAFGVSYESHVHVPMQMIAKAAHYRVEKMLRASRTWRVKTAGTELRRYILVIPPRDRKVLVLTRNSPYVYACLFAVPAMWYTREEEEEEEVSWHNQPAHRSWPRATCVGVQRIIAMSAVIYEAIILVCRCRGREGCPVFLSLFLSLSPFF